MKRETVIPLFLTSLQCYYLPSATNHVQHTLLLQWFVVSLVSFHSLILSHVLLPLHHDICDEEQVGVFLVGLDYVCKGEIQFISFYFSTKKEEALHLSLTEQVSPLFIENVFL